MARGNPRLLTWDPTSNTVRLFELSETGFVQRASYGVANNMSDARSPRLMFLEDSATIAVSAATGSTGTSSSSLYMFDKDLTYKSTIATGVSSQVSTVFDLAPWHKRRIVPSYSYPAPKWVAYTAAYAQTGAGGSISNNGVMDVAPDDDMVLISSASGWNNDASISLMGVTYLGNGLVDSFPTMSIGFTSAVGARFLGSSLFVVTLTNSGAVRLWRRNGNSLTLLQEMTGLGIAQAPYLDCSTDGRYFTVMSSGSPGAKFFVFKRTANSFALVQTITLATTGPEAGNHFSEGGDYLISARNKQVFKRGTDGLYVELPGFASALPTNVRTQAVSTHALGMTTTSKMYAAGLGYLMQHVSSFGETKFALLNSSATFNVEATSAAAILVNEVSGLGWPSGGVPLQNIHLEAGPVGSYLVTCDPVQQIILADITARYGLIYAGDVPLVFVDLLQPTTFVAYSLLSFAADARGLMSVSL